VAEIGIPQTYYPVIAAVNSFLNNKIRITNKFYPIYYLR